MVILDEIKGTRRSWQVYTILFMFGLKEKDILVIIYIV